VSAVTAAGDLLRLAAWQVWGERCVWCRRPVSFAQVELDHLLPRSLAGDTLAEALRLHGLAAGWDPLAQPNVAPACRECNLRKGARIPPNVPIVVLLLAEAAEKAPLVEQAAARLTGRRRLDAAVKIVLAAGMTVGPGEAAGAGLEEAAVTVAAEVEEATGARVRDVHPAVRLLRDPERWTVVRPLANDVAYVGDGTRGGVTGTHWSWECDRCGGHGPWDGNRCVVCGNWSFPDW
jgi:hypothetical protein